MGVFCCVTASLCPQVTYLFDNGATVFFAVFMAVWGESWSPDTRWLVINQLLTTGLVSGAAVRSIHPTPTGTPWSSFSWRTLEKRQEQRTKNKHKRKNKGNEEKKLKKKLYYKQRFTEMVLKKESTQSVS